MADLVTFTAKVEQTIFPKKKKGDADPVGWRIVKMHIMELEGKKPRGVMYLTAKGDFPGVLGDTLQGRCRIKQDPRWAESFLDIHDAKVVESFKDTDLSLINFMVNHLDGIGKVTAQRLIRHFGREQLVKHLDDCSDDLSEVRGISVKTLAKIWDSWTKHSYKADIWVFLHKIGITSPERKRAVVKKFGRDAEKIISAYPYKLMSVNNIGFRVADEVATRMGWKKDGRDRVMAGIYHVLSSQRSGHTYMLKSVLKDQSEVLLDLDNIPDLAYEQYLVDMEKAGKIVTESGNKVFHKSLHSAEKYLASQLVRMRYTCSVSIPRKDTDDFVSLYQFRHKIKFTKTQINAILRSAQEGVMVITGNPGSGKTTIVGALVELFNNFKYRVNLCSPTGKSARRIKESTGFNAETIHRMLRPINGSLNHGFFYNEDNPLDTDVVVVDEISMVDVELMASLLRAIPDTAKLIIIGDKDQLPAVGPGNVLNDCIASGKIAAIHLRTVFRQGKTSPIIANALKVNTGDVDLDLGLSPEEDWLYDHRIDITTILNAVKWLENDRGFNRADIKVITPFRRELVDVNVNMLNRTLQARYNPKKGSNEVQFRKKIYRIGDPVMQTENDYSKMVFNGDSGYIVDLAQDSNLVSIKVDFGGDIGNKIYSGSEINRLELAYAMTIHRAQGSEFPAVIIILPEAEDARSMLKRNLLYTAITRAQNTCVLLAPQESVSQAITDNSYSKRLTMLQEWIIRADRNAKKFKRKGA